jgi:Glycosyltransferase family 87
MTKARQDGLVLLFLGATMMIMLAGYLLTSTSRSQFGDFKASYYAARCLLAHCDPYNQSDMARIVRDDGELLPSDTPQEREVATRYIYPPTTFPVTVPFAMLPWSTAKRLWMMLTVVSLIFAGYLAWNLGADDAPRLSGVLIGFILANTEVVVALCNPSGIAVSLCIVAVWCFLRERFAVAGVLCLAVSLAIKPQDADLVWLYFLLAGGVYRKRALQSLLGSIAISLPSVLWLSHVAPNWLAELRSNLVAFSAHGTLNDPGPASTDQHTLVNLQVVVSRFVDNPHIYNPVSYLICAPVLIAWIVFTLRTRPSPARARLAIAAIAVLSMLPFYHHLYDAKLLLLTVPACALLWARGGRLGRIALGVNLAAFILTGDISSAILLRLIELLHPARAGFAGWMVRALLVFPAPLILLTMSIFYLWVYKERSSLPESAYRNS